jgi:hypothetical protein
VVAALGRATADASEASGAEEALWCFTKTIPEVLGDREAHLKPGNLLEGEKHQFACGAFVVTPDRKSHMIFAPVNYGPTQRHQKVDITLGHPAWVAQNQKPLLLENTAQHASFVKILQTFRAGSVVYGPLMWKKQFLGQIICASQARNVFSAPDLEAHVAFSNAAAIAWVAHGGPDLIKKMAG